VFFKFLMFAGSLSAFSLPLIAETSWIDFRAAEGRQQQERVPPPEPTFLQPAALGIAALTLTAPP
jgi:hypothetical protein